MNPYIVYDMVDVINKTATCPVALKEELTRALYAGSSGLEILDGIAHVFRDPQYQIFIDHVLQSNHLPGRKAVIAYVDTLFGRQSIDESMFKTTVTGSDDGYSSESEGPNNRNDPGFSK